MEQLDCRCKSVCSFISWIVPQVRSYRKTCVVGNDSWLVDYAQKVLPVVGVFHLHHPQTRQQQWFNSLPEVQVAPREYLTAAVPLCVLPYRLSWPSSARPVNRPEMCVLEVDERRHANHDVLGYPGRKAPDILGL